MTASRMLSKRARASFALVVAVVFVAMAAIVSPAVAMRVSPMVVEMTSRGSGAVARIEVQNINSGNLPFETRVFRMSIDKNGNITETPADDKFLIFPPQGALPPGGRQVIRLQWVGDAEPATSEAYYISVEQLPVALAPVVEGDLGAQVQVLYNMRALVVVAPPGAQPDVKALTAKQTLYQPPAPQGSNLVPPMQDGVEITLRNDGRRHAMMSNLGWRLEGIDRDGKYLRVDVSSEELNNVIGTGYVPGIGERTFRLPVPGFGAEPIKVSFIK